MSGGCLFGKGLDMKVTPQFSGRDIEKDLKQFAQDAFRVTLSEFTKVGLDFVEAARMKSKIDGGFDDRTGNLRSSIGFMIFFDGEEVHSDFQASRDGTDRTTGMERGRAYARELGIQEARGWAIITVAGMEYASWVEAKGYDVISGSTLDGVSRIEEASRAIDRAMAKWRRR